MRGPVKKKKKKISTTSVPVWAVGLILSHHNKHNQKVLCVYITFYTYTNSIEECNTHTQGQDMAFCVCCNCHKNAWSCDAWSCTCAADGAVSIANSGVVAIVFASAVSTSWPQFSGLIFSGNLNLNSWPVVCAASLLHSCTKLHFIPVFFGSQKYGWWSIIIICSMIQ